MYVEPPCETANISTSYFLDSIEARPSKCAASIPSISNRSSGSTKVSAREYAFSRSSAVSYLAGFRRTLMLSTNPSSAVSSSSATNESGLPGWILGTFQPFGARYVYRSAVILGPVAGSADGRTGPWDGNFEGSLLGKLASPGGSLLQPLARNEMASAVPAVLRIRKTSPFAVRDGPDDSPW